MIFQFLSQTRVSSVHHKFLVLSVFLRTGVDTANDFDD